MYMYNDNIIDITVHIDIYMIHICSFSDMVPDTLLQQRMIPAELNPQGARHARHMRHVRHVVRAVWFFLASWRSR